MKKFTGVKGTLILVILIIAMVAYYGYLSNQSSRKEEKETSLTKVQKVLLRDLEMNYPPTPKEVIKYFGEITLCLYDGNCQETDIDKLAKKAVQLYDAELIAHNPWGENLLNLKAEIEEFKNKNMTITNYVPAGSTNVDFFTEDNYDWARIYCTFYVKKEKHSEAVNEIFLLRRDENGYWKIYGWDLAENVKIPEE